MFTRLAYLIVLLLSLALIIIFVFPGHVFPLLVKYDYEIALPDGYLLSRIWSGAYRILNASPEVVVGLTVTKYAAEGSLVTGFVTHKGVEDHPDLWGKEGYFVLDTATGALQDGLSEDKWRAALASRGISPPPPLKEPSREDAMEPEQLVIDE